MVFVIPRVRSANTPVPLPTAPSGIVAYFVPRKLQQAALNQELLPVLIFSMAGHDSA